jgi:hypothetical protein
MIAKGRSFPKPRRAGDDPGSMIATDLPEDLPGFGIPKKSGRTTEK